MQLRNWQRFTWIHSCVLNCVFFPLVSIDSMRMVWGVCVCSLFSRIDFDGCYGIPTLNSSLKPAHKWMIAAIATVQCYKIILIKCGNELNMKISTITLVCVEFHLASWAADKSVSKVAGEKKNRRYFHLYHWLLFLLSLMAYWNAVILYAFKAFEMV